MTKKLSSGFNIKFDDESPDTLLRDEKEDKPSDQKDGRHGPLALVIVTLVLCFILAGVYLDLKRRIDNTKTVTNQSAQNLSQEQQTKFSSLSLKYAQLEDSYGKKITQIDAIIKKIDKKLASSSQNEEASQNDIKSLKSELSALRKDIKKLEKNDSNNGKQVDQLTGKLENIHKKITDTSSALQKIKNEIGDLESNKIEKQDVEKLMDSKQKQYEERLDKIATKMEIIILSIKNRLKELEKNKNTDSSAAPVPQNKPDEQSTQNIPKPGEFIEQNVQ